MFNVILFWIVVFYIIYVFTRREREERMEEEGGDILEAPCRRDELQKVLKDGLSNEEKDLELRRFGHRCFNCGSQDELQFDHHLPLSHGYPLKSRETGSNVVVLCKKCNKRKGSTLPGEFYTEEKLRKLEEMGIRSHLYYSSRRIEEIENLLIGEKIKKLKRYAEDGQRVAFSYYDMTKILFVREEVEEIPIKVYSRRRIACRTTGWDYFLEGKSGRLYNIAWLYKLRRSKGGEGVEIISE